MVRLADDTRFLPDDVEIGALTEDIVIDGETITGQYTVDEDSAEQGTVAAGPIYRFSSEVRLGSYGEVATDNAMMFISRFEFDTEDDPGGWLTGILGTAEEEVELEWVPANVRDVQSQIDSAILEYVVGVDLGRLFDPLLDTYTHRLESEVGTETSTLTAIPFRQVRIPEIDGLRETIESIDPIEIDVVPRFGGFLDQLTYDIIGRAVMTLEIPPSIFVEWVDADLELDCLEVSGGLVEEADSIRNRINSLQSEASDLLGNADSAMRDVVSFGGYVEDQYVIDRDDISEAFLPEITDDDIDEEIAPVSEDESDVPLLASEGSIIDINDFDVSGERDIVFLSSDSFIRDIEVGEIEDLAERDIQEWSDTVEEARGIVEEYEDILDDIEDLKDSTGSAVYADECRPELRGYLRESITGLPELQSDVAVLNAFSTDYEFLKRLDMELIDTRLDVPDSLINQVEQFISAVEAVDPPLLEDRLKDLISEGEDVIDAIESELDESHPEKGELLSDVRDALSSLRLFDTYSVEGVPDNIQNAIDDFESAIDEVGDPILEDDKEGLLSQGQEVIEQIETELEPTHPEKQNLIGNVSGYMSQIERLGTFERGDLPCGELYPEIDERLENIEIAISRIERASVEPDGTILEPIEGYGTIDELVNDIEDVGDEVNRVVEEGDCVDHFRDRIDSLVSQAEARMTGVRVDDEALGRIEDRRQELLERIEGRLEEPFQ